MGHLSQDKPRLSRFFGLLSPNMTPPASWTILPGKELSLLNTIHSSPRRAVSAP